ncbi:hypothetical protein NDU88_003820 [Pleurodeles waltl]|uniref:Uncharacterized protein n=1 Tax=Pleurodeles waltl TaxID=8319 RepID=A0AAV7QAS8_PLEWA|nr:hypothetical protein NDU88_003820 [Pleurodeles waltl]
MQEEPTHTEGALPAEEGTCIQSPPLAKSCVTKEGLAEPHPSNFDTLGIPELLNLCKQRGLQADKKAIKWDLMVAPTAFEEVQKCQATSEEGLTLTTKGQHSVMHKEVDDNEEGEAYTEEDPNQSTEEPRGSPSSPPDDQDGTRISVSAKGLTAQEIGDRIEKWKLKLKLAKLRLEKVKAEADRALVDGDTSHGGETNGLQAQSQRAGFQSKAD